MTQPAKLAATGTHSARMAPAHRIVCIHHLVCPHADDDIRFLPSHATEAEAWTAAFIPSHLLDGRCAG